MKFYILLFAMILSFAACKKEDEETSLAKTTKSITPATENDTISDHAAFKVKLVKDSTNYDETMFIFDHRASLAYHSSYDAMYFQGFGQESLSSISSDGTAVAIKRIPYSSQLTLTLNIYAKTDGAFFLSVSYQSKIPSNVQIWLRDNYQKDSVNLDKSNYHFNVIKSDTNSYGKCRFKLFFKKT